MATTLRCIIAYTAPDGKAYKPGETYDFDDDETASLLQAGAAGQFVVEARKEKADPVGKVKSWLTTPEESEEEEKPLEKPPADRSAAAPRKR